MMKTVRVALINVAVLSFCLLLAEGAASLYYAFDDVRTEESKRTELAERLHTEHDPLLGWINKKNLHIPDMYGPGVHITTNSQRFRNKGDFPVEVPQGKTRIICSGDSFAFGFGVANDQVWCNRLAASGGAIESVNMGQGGYGFDQAYLWYRRDGAQLDHQLHIASFISIDFQRMTLDTFLGIPKPILGVENGVPKVMNNPVPSPTSRYWSKYLQGLGLNKLANSVAGIGAGKSVERKLLRKEQVMLIRAIFGDLNRISRSKNARLLLVHLPLHLEYGDRREDSLRQFLKQEAKARAIPYLDLVEVLRRMPASEVNEMYFRKDIKGYFRSAGHLNEKGNAFVAAHIQQALKTCREGGRTLLGTDCS